MKRQIKLLDIGNGMGGRGHSEQTTSRCFALSFSGRKESGIIFLNNKFGFKIWDSPADQIISRTRKPVRTDEQTFSCILDHTAIECRWGWPDEFPQESEENEPRTTQVGSDGKMNRPLHKIVAYPVFNVEKARGTKQKHFDKVDFGDQNAY